MASQNTMIDVAMDSSVAFGYTSRSQIARRITEDWVGRSLYCAACSLDRVRPTTSNTAAVDFRCERCDAPYQLKSTRRLGPRLADAGHAAMIAALRSDSVPNLLVMEYAADWRVRELLLIPGFFFAESSVEKRKPLSPTARRAGWVGCNIRLDQIAPQGKIQIVSGGAPMPAASVRAQYESLRPVARLNVALRGWALDVLQIVQSLGRTEFSLRDVYQSESKLANSHPKNNNVRAKIRQQLQVLRDLSFVEFVGAGQYRLRYPS